ncbi:MAG TPA: NAD(P)H-hydrate epimerase, partial [Planctomycetota bacterium]|nr:NAD(P)H-hydrate epimerase [Planctomycetota bacterium]
PRVTTTAPRVTTTAPRVTTTAPRVTTTAPALGARTLLVDGLFGVGLRRPLQGAARAAAAHIDASDATVLSIDIPSGLHATTGAVPAARGSPRGVAIRADLTLTFVAPKRGFFLGSGPALVGAWRVVDLGFPPRLAHEWLARRRAAEAAP